MSAKRAVSAKRVNVAHELVESVSEMAEIMAERREPARVWQVPGHVDVRALRHRLNLSQPAFAERYGLSLGSLRDWEQGRRRPDPAARTLLMVIDHDPDVVPEVLRKAAAS